MTVKRGSPAAERKQITPFGKYGEHREAWVKTGHLELVSYVRPADRPDRNPDYANEETLAGVPEVVVHIKIGPRTTKIHLTALRLDELEALRSFLNAELDRVRPYVETLDQTAEEAFSNGDDSFARLYRPVPIVHHRQRGKPQHGEGIRQRPPGLAGGVRGDAGGPAGGDSRPVVDRESGDVVAQDNLPEGNVTEGIRSLDGEN